MSKVTINDIAKKLNVTAGTVSRALNDHPAISEATKKAVRKKARQMNYRQNKMASYLRSGKSFIIGVLIPSAKMNFFGSVVHGIENVASKNGYSTLLYQSNEGPESEIKGLDTFIRSGVDGILASISRDTVNYDHFLEIKEKGIPLIFFDRSIDEMGVPSVVIDDYKGAYQATEHLIQQGCKRIAHISGPQHIGIFKNRFLGYKEALTKNSMAVEDTLILPGRLTIEDGMSAMTALLNLPEPPDGVFAVEDFTALGALKVLKDQGKKIPEEVAVVGFANEEFGKHITPSLSTVGQQTIRMGEKAAELLIASLKNNNFYKEEPQKITLEPEMIWRESSLRKISR